MSLDHLWAGWRSEYVISASELPDAPRPGEDEEATCVFCRIVASPEPDDVRHVVATGPLTIAMLNAYPYASGHLLVMPKRHVRNLKELDVAESEALWTMTTDAVEALTTAYAPEGLNLGANLGRAAGAGIPRHLHLHVVPRWVGDTNFMTTVASTRVLPEALSVSWDRLRSAWPT